MKPISRLTTIMTGVALALSLQASEVEQMKSDLIGQGMGGREKCWRFHSVEQIKELVIRNKTQDAQERVYTIDLQLQSSKATGKYAAEARVEYIKSGDSWKIKQVGLLSLKKIE